jgi:membrane protein
MRRIVKIRRSLSGSAPVTYIVSKSRNVQIPGFRGVPFHDVVKFFFRQVRTIAFNFVMAIPPAIIFLFTLIPFLPISRQFEQELYGIIRDVVPGEKDNSVLIGFLQDFINNPRNGLLSLGFLLSIFFSSNAMMGIMRSFDKNYIGFRKRTNLQKRGIALKLTMILFFIMFLSILLIISRESILKYIGIRNDRIIGLIRDLRWLVLFLLFFISISLIYRYAPAVQKKWRLINPGSILATFLMILFTMGFSYWVNHFGNYNQLYGSIGTVLIVMLLIYFNSLVLLIGFELNVSISTLRKIADQRNKTGPDGTVK